MPDFALDRLRRPSWLDAIDMFNLIDSLYFVGLALRYHLMLEVPAGAAGEFSYDYVAVAEEVDVKVDMVDWLVHVSLRSSNVHHNTHIPRDEDLGYIARQEVWDLRDGSNFHACAHDDDQIYLVLVNLLQAVEEVIRKCFAEEGDVWLHDAWLWYVVRAVRL
jgi:hypothetical protein